MIRNAHIIYLICSLLTIYSCRNKSFPEETEELTKFLNEKFNHTLPNKGKGIYLLIPSCQCKSCIVFNTERLQPQVLDNLYLVTSIDTMYFPGFRYYFLDKENRLMKLSFLHYANQIVLTEGSQIAGVIRLRDFEKQLDSLSDWIKE